MKTRKQVKEEAQDKLMQAMQVAWNHLSRAYDFDESDIEKVTLDKEMDLQFQRVEKLFGYEKKSWSRGV